MKDFRQHLLRFGRAVLFTSVATLCVIAAGHDAAPERAVGVRDGRWPERVGANPLPACGTPAGVTSVSRRTICARTASNCVTDPATSSCVTPPDFCDQGCSARTVYVASATGGPIPAGGLAAVADCDQIGSVRDIGQCTSTSTGCKCLISSVGQECPQPPGIPSPYAKCSAPGEP
jgi:hypothetical protein